MVLPSNFSSSKTTLAHIFISLVGSMMKPNVPQGSSSTLVYSDLYFFPPFEQTMLKMHFYFLPNEVMKQGHTCKESLFGLRHQQCDIIWRTLQDLHGFLMRKTFNGDIVHFEEPVTYTHSTRTHENMPLKSLEECYYEYSMP